MSNDRLTGYRSKRDTAAFGEPAGRRGKKGGGEEFVVQRHPKPAPVLSGHVTEDVE